MAAGLLQSCERLALLAMTKPGQFVFTVTSPVTLANSATCKLAPAAL